MTALTGNRGTDSRDGLSYKFPVAASTKIYAGSLVAINSDGYAVPAAALAGNKGCPGVAIEYVDNSAGAASAKWVTVKKGVYQFASAGAAQSNVGETAYASDDQTVVIVDAGNLPPCGKVVEYVSATSVWVEVFGFDVTY